MLAIMKRNINARSVVGVFTQAQEEHGRSGCSDKTATTWLRQYRPKVGISPHKFDYCDTCAKANKVICAKQTIINRLRQTGGTSAEDIQSIKDEIVTIKASLEEL